MRLSSTTSTSGRAASSSVSEALIGAAIVTARSADARQRFPGEPVDDALAAELARWRRLPELRCVMQYHDEPAWVDAVAASLDQHAAAHGGLAERVLFSFHGLPKRNLALGDPYHCQCLKSARLVAERLGLADGHWAVSFQSRFGRAEWLQPYTSTTLTAWARAGTQTVDVVCPGFAADCLETLEEIGQEVRDAFVESGGQDFRYVPCLNDDADWIEALARLAEGHLQGWDTRRAPVADEAGRQRALAMGASN